MKIMTLVKTAAGVAPEEFRSRWGNEFFVEFQQLPVVREHLTKATHNHVLPHDIRSDEGLSANRWAGVSSYYFDSRASAEQLLTDPAYLALLTRHQAILVETTHLLVDEVWIYNRDLSHLPIKAFAFFKRLPTISRAEALAYYRGPHAELGASVNRNRTVRYVQNHVAAGYTNPDSQYDYDGGPEIWFKNMEIALDLFGDKHAMETLGKDEATFVVRDALLHFLTDEQPMYDRASLTSVD
jgi:hypothetical protein